MSEKPRKLITIDCETDPFKFGRIPTPFIWGTFDGKKFQYFNNTEDLMEYLSHEYAIIYAHNGGNFDYDFLKEYLEPYKRIKIINERLSEFKIKNCVFRDSFLILPIALKQYKKDDIDYEILEKESRDIPENRAKIIKYLEGDCRYLYEIVAEFRKTYGGKLTLASSSLFTWSKMSGEKIPKTNKYFYDTFKPYYHGGRVSTFKLGVFEKNIQVWDINSAYPFAMSKRLPWGVTFQSFSHMPPDEKLEQCFLTFKANSLGALPYIEKNKLEFPNDRQPRIFQVTGWEYLSALKTNCVQNFQLLNCKMFDESITFKEYIDRFYGMKKAAKKESADYIFAKLFQNSLYGKFAANPAKYEEYVLIPPSIRMKIEAGEDERFTDFKFHSFHGPYCLMYKKLPEEKHRYYNLATGASITGFVRGFLWEAICKSKNPYYCDTDSIISEGFTGEVGEDLGQWKLEFSGNKIGIAGKKTYAVTDGTPWRSTKQEPYKSKGWKTACKGVRFTGPEIMRVAAGEVLTYDKPSPSMGIKAKGAHFISRKIKRQE